MTKFETDKWYYFKDNDAESKFRLLCTDNDNIANTIINGEGFRPVRIEDGDVYKMELSTGEFTSLFIKKDERRFFEEEKDDDTEDECEDVGPSEPSDFPLTKITISNNSEAWTVYQMLKAHFKE
ncbi:goF mRNA metabolism modulator, putative [Escherichia phage JS10]|uniref:GoF mRNA metabolism modulator, putative n=1 Tax=Escherichia phage JS10 TaxID=576790 RepID=C4MZA1_9CAUD|nr:goF mRNA metabolism modulator, putative [Escherichia phage JS10]ACL78232.1 goF mRNA metabolism modulator, putative [Escherichia phage JS10]QBP35620.1 hypothetical protein [Phage NC-G]